MITKKIPTAPRCATWLIALYVVACVAACVVAAYAPEVSAWLVEP
jgi:hypothetical protein